MCWKHCCDGKAYSTPYVAFSSISCLTLNQWNVLSNVMCLCTWLFTWCSPHQVGVVQISVKKPIFVFLVCVEELLKLFMLGLSTASWFREFHLSMTRSLKKCFRRSSRQWCLANLKLWPLVWLTAKCEQSVEFQNWQTGMYLEHFY